jgi:alpha,alpha-trehalose phosphorylase
MIDHPAFNVEPWVIRETSLNLDVLAQTESVFALSNGHIGLRGNLDEGEPHGIPGTYLNSVYESRPLPYAEAGYGYPTAGQTVINITNGKIIRLLVDDEPLDVRYGTVVSHERVLDMRAGTLTRRMVWTSPSGCSVRITSVRMVSLTHRGVAAINYQVEPVDSGLRVVLQSELVANESLPGAGEDPRTAAMLESPLAPEESMVRGTRALMVHRTKATRLLVGAGMDHDVIGPDDTLIDSEASEDVSRVTVAAQLPTEASLRIIKFVAYGWSGRRSRPAVHDQVVAAITGARMSGWDGLLSDQRAFLDEYWSGADVEVDGDAEVQQAVRFGLFHLLQAGARAERRPIPAKGLTGPGYDGHTFWDSEMYVLPALTYTHPKSVADALEWRHRTLPIAEEHARSLRLDGAAFAWRTINGQECSGYWPAGTAAFHVNADIAAAVIRYVDATDDRQFEESTGLPLLVATARLWRSLGQHDMEGRFRIDGVTGPDEYSAVHDNNVYTNLMAEQNMRVAAEVATRYRKAADALGVTNEEAASWRDAADAIVIPYDDRLGVHPQSEGFTDHARWDFDSTSPDDYPLLLHFPYFDLYRKQVVKQADLVLAMALRGDRFTDDQKARNFAYYEAITVRDSSLSASTQAVIAAEVGQLELAHDYLGEAALMDLNDLEKNTRDGLHMASLAGAWTALVMGFGGMRTEDGNVSFAPRLPSGISVLSFRLRYRGRRLRVTVEPGRATYELLEGHPMTVTHHGQEVDLGHQPVSRPIAAWRQPGPRPSQPKGRAPATRHAGGLP